jgi:ribosomal protein S18 acetylase RimI-like enzyme
MTILHPMTQEAFLEWKSESVPAYAAEKIASGQWQEAQALALAQKSFDELLPQGLSTPDNLLFTLRDQDVRVDVGTLWVAVQDRAGKRVAYVYDVVIRPEHQRKGHATRAFRALEDVVRSLGIAGIALHVFGHNAAAHALYVKLGYRPTNINMYKPIEATSCAGT